MELDSYLEIFTTLYGWAFANIIGEVLAGTGLIALPFALIVFNAWRESKESASGGQGMLALIDAVMVKLVVAMFVFAVCFATTPFTSLVSVNLRYTPKATILEPNPAPASLNGGTGSGYDQAMKDASDGSMSTTGSLSYVPAWWFTVMAISSGVNNAVRNGLTNANSDIRMVEDMARTATIEDPKLLNDVQRFYSECFVPARSRFLRTSSDDLSQSARDVIAPGNTDYGPTDVDWMGSRLFRMEFYNSMRSYNPVPGFEVDLNRDTDYIGPVNPEWGRPTCNEWWISSPNGIRTRMINHSSTWQQMKEALANATNWKSDDLRDDSLAKLAQTRAQPQFVDSARIMGNDYDGVTNLVRSVGGAVSTVGVGMSSLVSTVAFVPLINGLPMMQALMLMGMYMFLPLIVFLSGYDLKVMLVGGIAIFTVKFCSVMWYIAAWVDARLIRAMYPGLDGNIFMQEINAIVAGQEAAGYKRMLLNLLLVGMFVGLPMLWMSMMAWIGMRVGDGVSQMMRSTEGQAKGVASQSTGAVSKGRMR